jgi:hypothetical protein
MTRDHDNEAQRAAGRGTPADRRPVDREVPLQAVASADQAQAVIHAWLDGELSEAEAHGAAPSRVRFWRELTIQATGHRSRTAPGTLLAAVMEALPPMPPAVPMADMPRAEAPAPTRPAAPREAHRPGEASR